MAAAVVAAGVLAGCTGGGSTRHSTAPPLPNSHSPIPLATGTVNAHLSSRCARLAAAAEHINAAQTKLYTSRGTSSIHALQAELRSLRGDAPADVSAALGELAAGFGRVQQALAHPDAANDAVLTRLQPKLAADALLVSHYVVGTCSSH